MNKKTKYVINKEAVILYKKHIKEHPGINFKLQWKLWNELGFLGKDRKIVWPEDIGK